MRVSVWEVEAPCVRARARARARACVCVCVRARVYVCMRVRVCGLTHARSRVCFYGVK